MEMFSAMIGLAVFIGLYEYTSKSKHSTFINAIIGVFSSLFLTASIVFPEERLNTLNGIYEMATQNTIPFILSLLVFALLFSRLGKKEIKRKK